jgi:hypothetical protein
MKHRPYQHTAQHARIVPGIHAARACGIRFSFLSDDAKRHRDCIEQKDAQSIGMDEDAENWAVLASPIEIRNCTLPTRWLP